MSLLLPVLSTEIIEAMCLFTFHYVSITTVTANNYFKVNTDFTFHYVSITTQYTDDRNYNALLFFTFHYVSITTGDIREGPLDDMLFTFHYVSITTTTGKDKSTTSKSFTFHYVSITTRGDILFVSNGCPFFTFHYVSITTDVNTLFFPDYETLHSTMSLLLPVPHNHPHYNLNSITFCRPCHFLY